MRKIFLTEGQLQYIISEGTALGKMAKTGRTSGAQRFNEVCSDNELLKKEGMSLFKPEAESMMNDLLTFVSQSTKNLKQVLEDDDEEIFTDEAAKEFVNYRVLGGIFNGNLYSQKLAEIKAKDTARYGGSKDTNLTDSQKIVRNRAEAKQDREKQYIEALDDVDYQEEIDYETAKNICSKYPNTYFKGNTVYMFISNEEGKTKHLTPVHKTKITNLKDMLRRNGFEVGPSAIVKSTKKNISYILFNIGQKPLKESINEDPSKYQMRKAVEKRLVNPNSVQIGRTQDGDLTTVQMNKNSKYKKSLSRLVIKYFENGRFGKRFIHNDNQDRCIRLYNQRKSSYLANGYLSFKRTDNKINKPVLYFISKSKPVIFEMYIETDDLIPVSNIFDIEPVINFVEKNGLNAKFYRLPEIPQEKVEYERDKYGTYNTNWDWIKQGTPRKYRKEY